MAKPDPKTPAKPAEKKTIKMARISLKEGQSYTTADGTLNLKKGQKVNLPVTQAKQYEKNGRLHVEYFDMKPKAKKKAKPVEDD